MEGNGPDRKGREGNGKERRGEEWSGLERNGGARPGGFLTARPRCFWGILLQGIPSFKDPEP